MTRETTDERAARILGELRAATAQAGGMVKDLRALVREVRELLPREARAAVARELAPMLDDFSVHLTTTIHAAEVEIKDRFNETSQSLDALMADFVARGNLYRVGMPVVEGVKAVEELIENAKRATRG